MEKYRNKRMMHRTAGGQFRKAVPADVGIGGVCPNCNHFLVRHYDGDEREPFIDPRKLRYRCFTCEPLTPEEQALQAEIEASKPKPKSFMDLITEIAEQSE